jgi:hypothetical protein
MGLYLLIALTVLTFFLAGPPLIMAYAALRERKEKEAKTSKGGTQ